MRKNKKQKAKNHIRTLMVRPYINQALIMCATHHNKALMINTK